MTLRNLIRWFAARFEWGHVIRAKVARKPRAKMGRTYCPVCSRMVAFSGSTLLTVSHNCRAGRHVQVRVVEQPAAQS